jgi:hypothetical protein
MNDYTKTNIKSGKKYNFLDLRIQFRKNDCSLTLFLFQNKIPHIRLKFNEFSPFIWSNVLKYFSRHYDSERNATFLIVEEHMLQDLCTDEIFRFWYWQRVEPKFRLRFR